jgi:hypothetical protein
MRFKVCIFVLYPYSKNDTYEAKNMPQAGNIGFMLVAACTSGAGCGCAAAAG